MDYVTIIQGDDTNFLDDQFIVVNFDTTIDLSGFTATFILGNVTLTYGNLSGKSFEIILSNEITSNLVIGKQYGELKLIDPQNRIRTITSIIPFLVKKGVNEDITFVNNSLNVSMHVNETVIDVKVETSGMSKTEANKILLACTEAKQSTQNHSNIVQNTLIEINEAINTFESDNSVLYDLKDEVERIGNEKIALSTEQAEIATQKVEEIEEIIATTPNSDLERLSEIGIDKINQTKGLVTGNVSYDKDIYAKLLSYKQNAIKEDCDILFQDITITGNVTIKNGITVGLNQETTQIETPCVLPTTFGNFHIHIEAIVGENYSNTSSYYCYSAQNGFGIQGQYDGSFWIYFYDKNYSTKMMQTPAMTLTAGERLVMDFGYKEGQGLYFSVTNGIETHTTSLEIDAWTRANVKEVYLGACSYSKQFNAEIDLANTYFETDSGITKPYVMIPYSLTKTGSKIAPSKSLDLIREIYETEGFANYFTLDEENESFTLPMGEIYGMISKRADLELSNTTPNIDFMSNIMNGIAPDVEKTISMGTVPDAADNTYTTPCAGWYNCAADVTDKRYLYINGTKSGYCLTKGVNQHSISVFLAKGDVIYWSGSLSVTYVNDFMPARGCKYEKSSSNEGILDGDLGDLFG